jgi:hypothetical protein
MKNKIMFLLFVILVSGCTRYEIVHNYKLEKFKDSDIPVCVDYSQRMEIIEDSYIAIDECENQKVIPEEVAVTDRICDVFVPKVVSYSYCLSELPKPVHLVEKKVGDMTICYDRNNKVELPILYCQKDMINIQMTDVKTSMSVTQSTNVLQKIVF